MLKQHDEGGRSNEVRYSILTVHGKLIFIMITAYKMHKK